MYADHEAGHFWGRLTCHPHHVWQVPGARCTQCPSPLRCNKFVCHAQSLDVDGLPDNGCEVPECFVILCLLFCGVVGVVRCFWGFEVFFADVFCGCQTIISSEFHVKDVFLLQRSFQSTLLAARDGSSFFLTVRFDCPAASET